MLNRNEKILITVYSFLLTFLIFLRFSEALPANLSVPAGFFAVFVPAFAIHSTPLAVSLRKPFFSLSWGLISLCIALLPFSAGNSAEPSNCAFKNAYLLPIAGFTYYHLIRGIYLIIFRREPITLWIKGFRRTDTENTGDLGIEPGGKDVLFTLVSFFGFCGIMLALVNMGHLIFP